MNKKLFWAGLVVIIVLVVIFTLGRGNKASTSVKIGAIAPLTGWGAYWAEGYVKGTQMAADEVNADGDSPNRAGQKKLEIVIEDGATESAKSATAAQKLINIDKVDGLIVEFTAPSSSVSPIALQNKIPMMYDAVARKIAKDNPLAFKMYFDMEKQCYVAANYLAKNGAKHIGGLIMNLDFAPECQAAMANVATETGVKVNFYLFPTETVDFRTFIAKAKSDGIDALVPVLFEDNAIPFFKQKGDLKFKVPVFLGLGVPDSFSLKVRASVATSSIEGVMTYDQEISPAFLTALKSKYPDITEKDYLSAAFGYDEAMRLYRALSACEKGDTACVTSKLQNDTWAGALTSKGFDENRVINVDPVFYRYVGGKLVEFKPE